MSLGVFIAANVISKWCLERKKNWNHWAREQTSNSFLRAMQISTHTHVFQRRPAIGKSEQFWRMQDRKLIACLHCTIQFNHSCRSVKTLLYLAPKINQNFFTEYLRFSKFPFADISADRMDTNDIYETPRTTQGTSKRINGHSYKFHNNITTLCAAYKRLAHARYLDDKNNQSGDQRIKTWWE